MCPECRVAYQLWASRCSDCDVDLVAWAPEPEPEVLPPANELNVLWRGTPGQLRALAEFLASAGTSSRIDRFPPSGATREPAPGRTAPPGPESELAIYVRPMDLASAESLRDELLQSRVPAPPETSPEPLEADACPACGHSLSPEDESCPDCGLEFPE